MSEDVACQNVLPVAATLCLTSKPSLHQIRACKRDIQANPEALNLYKSEWRRAQLMRALDERLIPRVKRSAFPPEAAPHGVAGQPPPSYITAPKARQRPPQAHSISLTSQMVTATSNNSSRIEVKDDSVIGVGRYIPGRPVDFTEHGMNTPQQDYTLLHASNRKTGSCAPYQDWKRTAQGGRRSKSLARVALKEEAGSDGLKGASSQMPPADYQHAADAVFKAAARVPRAPYMIDLGQMGLKPGISTCTSDHNVFASKPATKHRAHSVPSKRTAKELFEASARLAGGNPPVATEEDADAAKEHAVATCTQHLRSTADALRNYNVLHPHHRQPSAISSIATTYARAPKAPHISDSTFASPSERIAANYSLAAWGLSSRTLQKLSPAGIHQSSAPATSHLDIASLSTASKRIPFMPLELFDDEELETKTPQEWVASGGVDGTVKATTSWLNLNIGQHEQRPVRVLSYSSLERTFLVQFEGSGVRKEVKRLHLKFDSEDGAAFDARVAAAKRRRSIAEAELRLRFTVDAMDSEEVRSYSLSLSYLKESYVCYVALNCFALHVLLSPSILV